jgi:hypothetical protein
MGEVIQLKQHDRNWSPDFIVSARKLKNGTFEVCVEEREDGQPMQPGAIYRRVADQLVVICHGLHTQAEEMLPTPRGKVISQVTLYEDGTMDMHTVPLSEPLQRQWIVSAFETVIKFIKSKKAT